MRAATLVGLLVAVAAGAALAEAPPLAFEYRRFNHAPDEYRRLSRTAILYGPTTFQVRTAHPYRITRIEIIGEEVRLPSGRQAVHCRSTEPADLCSVDFGNVAAQQSFRIDVQVSNSTDGSAVQHSRQFVTLDTYPTDDAILAPDGLVERTETSAYPPDQVTRLVRVQRDDGSRKRRTRSYYNDLTAESFQVKVKGVRNSRVVSLRAPNRSAPKLIPILIDASIFLGAAPSVPSGVGWTDGYRDMVSALVTGLRSAALDGSDAEHMVLLYAATGRLFRPFRLYPGSDPSEDGRQQNEVTLGELEEFLEQPPPAEWNKRRGVFFVGDFGSAIHTLNDLYLRGYEGLVQGLWITGVVAHPSGFQRQFQNDLWPERVRQLNPTWSDERFVELLARLDRGVGVHDEALTRFIASFDDAASAAERIPEFLRELSPGATETLHPHRVNSIPLLNVLVVGSAGMLMSDQALRFSHFARENYGGEIFHLVSDDLSKTDDSTAEAGTTVGSATIARAIRETDEQLANSYVVDIEVPNPHQDGSRHRLILTLDKAGRAKELIGFEPTCATYYKSSRSVRDRLRSYLGSPFKTLRVLSAYELRKHWFDEELYAARAGRWHVENDDQVRAVLFETWVAMNLKRLQSTEPGKETRDQAGAAYEKLLHAGDLAAELPDHDLARNAATLAKWYQSEHRALF